MLFFAIFFFEGLLIIFGKLFYFYFSLRVESFFGDEIFYFLLSL
jgi:hypothetical protein